MTDLKFCKDCKHWRAPSNHHNWPEGDCDSLMNKSGEIVDLVSGYKYSSRPMFRPDLLRLEGGCGREGKWWEPK